MMPCAPGCGAMLSGGPTSGPGAGAGSVTGVTAAAAGAGSTTGAGASSASAVPAGTIPAGAGRAGARWRTGADRAATRGTGETAGARSAIVEPALATTGAAPGAGSCACRTGRLSTATASAAASAPNAASRPARSPARCGTGGTSARTGSPWSYLPAGTCGRAVAARTIRAGRSPGATGADSARNRSRNLASSASLQVWRAASRSCANVSPGGRLGTSESRRLIAAPPLRAPARRRRPGRARAPAGRAAPCATAVARGTAAIPSP